MQKLLSAVAIILLTTVCLQAQSPEKLYEKGMKALYDEEFVEAADYFRQIEATGKSYKDSKYRLEVCLLVQKEYRERPLDTILGFRELKVRGDKFYHYWMGRIFANRYMFPEALESWKGFLGRQGFKSDEIITETNNFIDETEKLVSYFDHPDDYEIHQLEAPVNTEYAELSPVYHLESEELIFTSNRENVSNDLFGVYETKSNNSEWITPTRIAAIADLERQQSSIEMVNQDGKLFVFNNSKSGSLHYTTFENGTWATPTEFNADVNASKLESTFFINEHEDRILFAAYDKKNSMEIMETFLDPGSGKWSDPYPIGAINTEYNEDSPYLSTDENRIYFSSDRPNGVGGYDIYMTELDPTTKEWQEPVNLGWPINSPDNDTQFKMNPNTNSGYFVSDRIHSKGDFDIFFFWGIEKTQIEGNIINAKTKEPITKGEIRFLPSQYTEEYFRSPIAEDGHYKTAIISGESFSVKIIQGYDTLHSEQLTIAVGKKVLTTKDFYVYPADMTEEEISAFEKENIPKEEKDDSTQVLIAENKKKVPQVKKEEKSKAKNNFKVSKKSQVLRNIYFEYGTSQLTDASEPKLMQVLDYLNEHPQKRIEISGHTDNTGIKSLNLPLSEQRAEAAKNWLVEHGIDSSRIEAVGYGAKKPLASNDDEKNGRELNRRIEIKEIE